MNKRIVGISLTAALAFSTASIAFAAGADPSAMMHADAMKPSSVMMMHPPKPMLMTISANGNGLLRGVVRSVGTDSLTVATWGGIWTVNVTANSRVVPAGNLSAIVVGDFVGVSGMVTEDAPTITANIVRDWSARHDAMMHNDSQTMMKNDTANSGDHMMATTSDSMHR